LCRAIVPRKLHLLSEIGRGKKEQSGERISVPNARIHIARDDREWREGKKKNLIHAANKLQSEKKDGLIEITNSVKNAHWGVSVMEIETTSEILPVFVIGRIGNIVLRTVEMRKSFRSPIGDEVRGRKDVVEVRRCWEKEAKKVCVVVKSGGCANGKIFDLRNV